MITNNFFINNILDDSFYKYISKPVSVSDAYFYRVFDNNCDTDRVTINGKIDKIVKLPKNLNIILNIDSMCGNIVHIPMISDIYIEYDLIKQLINIKDLNKDSYTSVLDKKIKILSVKNNNNITYQDIIIQTHKEIIIIQIYKFKIPFENITHGAVIIYQNDSDNFNQYNTTYYTKNNNLLFLDNITNNKQIYKNKTP